LQVLDLYQFNKLTFTKDTNTKNTLQDLNSNVLGQMLLNPVNRANTKPHKHWNCLKYLCKLMN